jgi:ATP adenylyltransferase
MDILWAPWRLKYILESSKLKETECIFCKALKENQDENNYIVYRGKFSFIILNAYPYNPGHVMVTPYRHVPSIEMLEEDEGLDLFKTLKLSVEALRRVYSPDGFNIGINIGKVAGAGIESHVHIHVVPRWNGDTNFMPVISNTKVIPETLSETYRKLKESIEQILKR